MNFREAKKYLFSLGNEVEAMKLGLENIRKLLGALEDPEKKYLKVQIAGTNGKGSVCAFLDSICCQAGIKTGVYTSPHLISITERVRISGVDIGEKDFARIATLVRETAEELVARGELETVPTFFEQVTAIALVAFAEAKVELAILETGLGGRFDAVTAANAEVCAITRIDLDHQEYLGDIIEKIATEKAAIIRADSKVVIGEQSPEAMAVIEKRVREVEGREMSGSECSVQFAGAHSLPVVFPPCRLGLAGNHQIENAKVAALLAEELVNRFPITQQNVIDGLKNARHPGRLEYIGQLLLDGAHNVGGAKALREYLDEFVASPITLIFGAMNDKDVAGIAEILFPKVDRIILTRPSNSRALTPDQLASVVQEDIDKSLVIKTDSVNEAIEKARSITPSDGIILVTGSLYLVGEVKKLLNN